MNGARQVDPNQSDLREFAVQTADRISRHLANRIILLNVLWGVLLALEVVVLRRKR